MICKYYSLKQKNIQVVFADEKFVARQILYSKILVCENEQNRKYSSAKNKKVLFAPSHINIPISH